MLAVGPEERRGERTAGCSTQRFAGTSTHRPPSLRQITRDPVRDAAVEASRAVTRRHGAVERSRSGEAKKSDSCIYSLANII